MGLSNKHLVSIACLTGFIGDGSLQVLTKFMGGKTGWGLLPYFKQHGSIESLFIAAGMMSLFYVIYLDILKLEPSWIGLSVYGLILDLIFRITMLFSSLDEYYRQLNYFWSGFWGAIPMVIPYMIVKSFK